MSVIKISPHSYNYALGGVKISVVKPKNPISDSLVSGSYVFVTQKHGNDRNGIPAKICSIQKMGSYWDAVKHVRNNSSVWRVTRGEAFSLINASRGVVVIEIRKIRG